MAHGKFKDVQKMLIIVQKMIKLGNELFDKELEKMIKISYTKTRNIQVLAK